MRAIFFSLLLVPLSVLAEFDQCRNYFPNLTPPKLLSSIGQTRDLCFDSFAVLHSGETKTPIFVVERLNRARLIDAKDEVRTDKFYEEARLPSRERARLDDYRGSGFDRGHMAPAADMPNPNAIAQSFSLANMVPQAPENNRGIWAKSVEQSVRKFVMRTEGDVYVFTGPVYTRPVEKIGAGGVWVPRYLFKLVYDESGQRALAYWVENRDDARMTPPILYDELKKRTNIDFLPGIRLTR